MKYREGILGVFIVAIVGTLIIPPSANVLDFLIMLNILLAVVIVLASLYATEPLQMSLFPTILLITTLFRLVLTVAAVRLILGDGYAGSVIATFGDFVARGDMVIGLVMFLILVLANYMVITKGSERVAEVTARFTLDAMPGKQMAIDADLNTGLINEEEAKARRQKISDEASFFGSMDGAIKFVKGDAIMSILATFVCIIGGIAIGMMRGNLAIGDAAEVYSLMTIGNGLAGLIPTFLISLAAGLLVTKVTSEMDISASVIGQLFSNSLVMYITGLVLVAFGAFTPLPIYVFIPVGLLVIYVGNITDRRTRLSTIQSEITTEDAEIDEIRRPENVVSLLNVDPILLTFGYGLIPLVDNKQGGDLLDRVVMIRRQLALELGVIVPIFRLRDDIKLSPNEYKILIKGVEIAGGDIMFDHYMAMNPGYVEDEIDGIETVEPYLGLPALWINESQRERAEALGYTVVDPPAIIATHLTEIVRTHLHEILSRQDVQTLIENVKESNPILVEELIPKLMTVGDVQKVLANLLRESISIRDLVTVLETLADYAHMTRDTDMLTEYVRQSLRRSISRKYFEAESNNVITLDPDLEQKIMNSVQHTEQGSYLAMDPNTTQRIFDKLNSEVTKLTSVGLQPIILTSPIVRIYFKRLVEQIAPDLVVLSYNELDATAGVQSVGMVSIA